jgi:TolB protein
MPNRMLLTLLASVALCTALAGRTDPPRSVVTEKPLAPNQDIVSLVLNGPGGRQPRLGLPDFTLNAAPDADLRAAAETVVEVLWHDLEFEQEFYVIPRAASRTIAVAATADALPLREWTEIGADFVLMASARKNGADVRIDVRVVAVTGEAPRRERFGMSYGCQLDNLRMCAHTIADGLHKTLRNLEGVARTRLAFVSDRGNAQTSSVVPPQSKEIFISDYDGAGQVPITANRSTNLSPSWSPDGRTIAYNGYSPTPDILVKSVYEARQAWRPAGGGDGINNINNYAPAFSPDGTQIAFVSNRDGTFQIYLVDAGGKTPPRRLTATRAWEGAPTWSPNGKQLAFTSDRLGAGTPKLYVMNADGTGQEALDCGPRCDAPSWSPSGDLIAFTCGTNTPYNICTIDLRSRAVNAMPTDGASNEQPTFAPNGRHIAYRTSRWGAPQIAIMDLKGRFQRRITEAGSNTYPNWSRAK